MKFISEYMSNDESRTARVYHRGIKDFVVIVKDAMGSYYNTSFETIRVAEDYAEDWVLKDERNPNN